MIRKNRKLFRLPLGLVSLFAWAVCLPASAEQWHPLQLQDYPVTLRTSGIVVSEQILRFGVPPNGQWQTNIVALAREGQQVKKGDLLVAFDSAKLDSKVRELTAKVSISRSELSSFLQQQFGEIENEKVTLAAAESVARKAARKASQPATLFTGVVYRKLLAQKRIGEELMVRAQQRQQLNERLRLNKRETFEMTIQQSETQLAVASKALLGFSLRAPQAGLVIIGKNPQGGKLDVNMLVYPGLVVVELVDKAALEIRAHVPEHVAARLANGQRVRIVVDAAAGAELEGRVSHVAKTVRRQSRGSLMMVRDITVSLNTQYADLRLGASVQLVIETALRKNTLAVPASALVYRAGQPGVMVKGRAWQAVELGDRSEDKFIVTAGLSQSQEVNW